MASSKGVYKTSVRAFSIVVATLGLAILATTLANGGGPLSIGFVMGIAFLAFGLGRLWLSFRIDR